MMELVQQLISNTGVSEEQAQGGAGLLLGLLKDKLSAADFTQVAAAVPDVEDLMASAPEGDSGLGGLLGGVASALGGSQLGDLASLAGGFSKLGLDADMIGKFAPVVLSFVESKGGEGLAEIVSKVLKGS
jgi:hypothetical protein